MRALGRVSMLKTSRISRKRQVQVTSSLIDFHCDSFWNIQFDKIVFGNFHVCSLLGRVFNQEQQTFLHLSPHSFNLPVRRAPPKATDAS